MKAASFGGMPVLMKRRNKQQWSEEDLAEIRSQVRRLTKLSPYLVVIVMPGGFKMNVRDMDKLKALLPK